MTLNFDRHYLISALTFVFIIGVISILWSLHDAPTDDSDEPQSPVPLAVGRGRVDIDGGLIQIAAQRDGVVAEVFVDEGANVKAGQPLARLDDRVPRAALNEARASLSESRAGLPVLAVRLNAAQRERDRSSALTLGGAESRKTFDEAQSRVEEAIADIGLHNSEVALAEARVKSAEVELMLREIYAPVDGRIVRRQARPGVGASTLSVSTLFTLVPAERYVVRVDLEESFVDKVKVGQCAQVTLEASMATVEGKVLRIGEMFGQRKIDPTNTQSRMDEQVLEVIVSLPPQPYRIGQRARVTFLPPETSAPDPSFVPRSPGVPTCS